MICTDGRERCFCCVRHPPRKVYRSRSISPHPSCATVQARSPGISGSLSLQVFGLFGGESFARKSNHGRSVLRTESPWVRSAEPRSEINPNVFPTRVDTTVPNVLCPYITAKQARTTSDATAPTPIHPWFGYPWGGVGGRCPTDVSAPRRIPGRYGKRWRGRSKQLFHAPPSVSQFWSGDGAQVWSCWATKRSS